MAMWTPGPGEILVILFVALLLFGRRLPEVGKSLGIGIKEFKKGLKEGVTAATEDEDDKAPRVVDAQASASSSKKDESARTSS
jgi:sec-independent protein translocase protein TatA